MADVHAIPFNEQVRGVNLGGWLVLEPWITPSMFYQFLNKGEGETGFDMYTFCEVLGPEEGNKQLRRHWDAWVTKDIIEELAGMNVNSLRLPVGDWMYKPYGPYPGCTDGSLEYVDLLLDWAAEYNLTVLLDIHGMKDSQNGFDNSGQSLGFEWTSSVTVYPAGLTTFQHWPIRAAEWMGKFDRKTTSYPQINYDNIEHSLDVIRGMVDMYKDHPAVFGLQPVNEPWELTPIEHLKDFYWEGYLIVKRSAPEWKYVMHDSFRFDPNVWGGFMAGCPDRVLDTHIYQAWNRPASRASYYNNACSWKQRIVEMENQFGPVIVGEWSLATDNCAMWLNGFNDNLPGFPMLPCKYIPCADPYMGTVQPGTPVDKNQPLQGPYGSGVSGPSWGQCPVDRDWLKEHTADPEAGVAYMHAPPEAPPNRDATDEVMTKLARKKINAFSGFGHGFYFWNFRTDLYEPHWSYMEAVKRGWITTGSLQRQHITSACQKEDMGEYRCVTKRISGKKSIQNGLKYALSADGVANTTFVDNLDDDALFKEGDQVFNSFWKHHRLQGATCDFGGAAMLVELNATSDDDEFNDDWTDDVIIETTGISTTTAIILITLGIALGAGLGFVTAMKSSVKFNRAVRKSVFFNNANSSIFVGNRAFLGNENMPLIPGAGGNPSSEWRSRAKSAHL
eukprot:CAMPEP_0172488684 /NCGR_PEP_ID=MMETSP1066-20121228/18332_1 /TAXON_ID=671091 /ORGANISM="Coscinodiscus wailesii, Strain CCMP2513" /LENGTH=673 /DNA_ID=CAMNT_0013256063 /DNA_START=132 /DNA_END=2153 /DNA_ORIENTATION=+